jgi:hypothetical protein
MAVGFVMKGQWDKMRALLDVRVWDKQVIPAVHSALGVVAKDIARSALPQDGLAKHAPLTADIRGGGPVLVDSGDLAHAIIAKRLPQGWWVGVPRSSPHYVKAEALENGAVIKVTDKMRSLFFVLWLVSQGKMAASELDEPAAKMFARYPDWPMLSDSTTDLRLPPRPFMRAAFAKNKDKYRVAVVGAITKAIRGLR